MFETKTQLKKVNNETKLKWEEHFYLRVIKLMLRGEQVDHPEKILMKTSC